MKYNLILISIFITLICKQCNTIKTYPKDKKEFLICGNIIDAKQTTSEKGNINNYIYQRLSNGDVKKIDVSDKCYYNWKDKIGSRICFSEETEEYNNQICIMNAFLFIIGVWLFITLFVFLGCFDDERY